MQSTVKSCHAMAMAVVVVAAAVVVVVAVVCSLKNYKYSDLLENQNN